MLVVGAITPENDNNLIKCKLIEMKYKLFEDKNSITDVGLLMSKFPLSPKLSKMIIVGKKVSYYIIVVWFNFIFSHSSCNNQSRIYFY